MDSRRFDALAKALVGGLPRRRLLGGLGASGSGRAGWAGRRQAANAQEEEGSVSLPCTPCGEDGECCLLGITGGGVLRTEGGDVNLILFATELGTEVEQNAAGFVRWVDTVYEGGVTLESVGAITYLAVPGDDKSREVRGTMQANGAGEHPFVLRVVDEGPEAIGLDSATLAVGDKAVEGGGATGFGYGATGTLVGGDLQLLNTVAPVG